MALLKQTRPLQNINFSNLTYLQAIDKNEDLWETLFFLVQAAVRVSRLSRTVTSSTALALAPLHDNLALAPVSPTPP